MGRPFADMSVHQCKLGTLFWDSHTTDTNLSTIALKETKLHEFQAAHGNVTLALGIRLL